MTKVMVLVAASVAAFIALVGPVAAAVPTETSIHQVPGPIRRATAALKPFNSSGIRGQLNFEDDGTELRVTGTASGMTPYRQYVSLVYGVNTVATGPNACGRDATLNFEQMLIAEWLPITGTTRTLTGSKATVRLNQIKTASVREINLPVVVNPFSDLPPQVFQLRACGLVVRTT